MREAIAAFEALGAKMVPVKFPSVDGLADVWNQINGAECAVAHAATFPSRRDEYGPTLASIIDAGRKVTTLELAAAWQHRLKFVGGVNRTMADIDLLLVPAIPDPCVDAAEWASDDNSGKVAGIIRFTAPFDFTGHPTLSLNGGFDSRGIPMGFQLVGQRAGEALMLKAGHAYQSITGWHTLHPALS